MPYTKPLPRSNYYAVIFCSTKEEQRDGYTEMDELTMNLAQEQEGYLGYESVNNGNTGIFISYWENKESIEKWRIDTTHKMAKDQAKNWYKRYLSQICLVESSHEFTK
ncbi:MAG: antibiotic biosynthesis monooxygenase family protein [Bacteroidota bacterium]|nr:antibiotic biosynthesis monooxygenase family protein [Bacteroidota bacterium]